MGNTTYFGTSINESPTITLPAGADLEGVQGTALAVSEGTLVKPSTGTNVMGISLFTMDDTVKKGDDVTVQIKDMGRWIAGAEITAGDELTTDAAGRAVPAQAGNFITAVALSSADQAGTIVKVQIIKAGYKPATA